MEYKHKILVEALADPLADILVYGSVKYDANGNSMARQSVFCISGKCLYRDGRSHLSYWYNNENERQAFEARGGLILQP